MSGVVAAFSTSSPLASVALFSGEGKLLWAGEKHAPNASSGALSELLLQSEVDLSTVTRFLADLGPGSFTGVRVGIVMAKVLAYANGVFVAGATSFDLINPNDTAYVPSRKGEVLIRPMDGEPTRAKEAPEGALGYAYGEMGQFPHAAAFAEVWDRLTDVDPAELLPAYFTEPSISTPKIPFRTAHV